jgi:hypothetical protein
MIHRLLAPLLGLSLLLVGCQEAGSQKQKNGNKGGTTATLPGSNGGLLDIIAIADDELWEQKSGNAFRKYFTKSQYGLPQPEPRYTVHQVDDRASTKLLRRNRNLVYLTRGEKRVSIQENVYAHPQLVVSLQAPNDNALAALINDRQDTLRQVFRQHELAYLQKDMRPIFRDEVHPLLKKHKVSLQIPRDFDLERAKGDFILYWKRTPENDQGIFVYFRPMPASLLEVPNQIVPIRDSLTRKYVQASDPGSFMRTETLIKPLMTPTELAGAFTLESRGLWRTTGTIMGGAFISYTVYDEKHDQLIYLDAFLYAPDQKKRNLMLRLEAILKTLEID